MLDTVRNTVSRHRMLSTGDNVLVAVSGGPDSVALLHALWVLREELGISLSVAHLNHGIRGEQADSEADFVQSLAARLELQAVVEKVDLHAVKEEMGLSMQEAARKVRYDFLRRTARALGANKIAVAHNADDQAETVLLNIIRGTGIDGLAGIPPVREEIVRPLINVFRTEIVEYLETNSLPYKTDPTNLTPTYMRNRVRLELIPLLESRFNPGVKNALVSLSELARAESDLIRVETEHAYRRLASISEAGVELRADDLPEMHEALARRTLRMAIEQVKGDLRDIELRHLDKILESARKAEDFTLTLPSGEVQVTLEAGILRIFQPEEPPELPPPFEQALEIPGRISLKMLGLEIIAEIEEPGGPYPDVSAGAVLDIEKIQGELIARSWRSGDRMTPLGMQGRKKLHDMFIDAKIPRWERYSIPVICDDEKIVWAPGLAVSELAKVDVSTRKVVRLALHSAGAIDKPANLSDEAG